MRVVIDTNVFASAVFFGGRPREVLELILMGKFEAFASFDIIAEYEETFEELCSRYQPRFYGQDFASFITILNIIEPNSSIDICRDKDDNKFIECALDAKCIYLVSGDKDLLTIGEYQGVKIVTVSELLKEI